MANLGQELSSIDFGKMLGGPLQAAITAQTNAALNTADFVKKVGFDQDGKIVYVDFIYEKEVVPYVMGNKEQVVSITIGASGSGYKTAPKVTFDNTGGGRGVAGIAILDGNGGIASITVTDGGGKYSAPPRVTIEPPPSAPGTAVATATATLGATENADPIYKPMKLTVPLLAMLPIPFIRIDKVIIDFNAKINSVETAQQSSSLGIDASLSASGNFGPVSASLSVSVSYKQSSQTGSEINRTYSMAVHMEAGQEEMPAGMLKIFGLLETQIKSVPHTVVAKAS